MAFGRNPVSDLYLGYNVSNLSDLTDEFMTYNAGRCEALLCPVCPVINVHVCTADRGNLDLDQYISWPNLWSRYVDTFHTLCTFCFNNRLHQETLFLSLSLSNTRRAQSIVPYSYSFRKNNLN